MTDCFILLNSGDKILLNDGVSRVLLNSCDGNQGVILQGDHAVADLRGIGLGKKKKRTVLVYTLEAHSRLSRLRMSTSTARLTVITESKATCRLLKISEAFGAAKLLQTQTVIAESMIFRRNNTLLEIYNRANRARNDLIEQKKDRLRKLLEEYRDEFDR